MVERLSIIEPGTLTIGIDSSAPPPLHSDLRSGHPEGFEVDLMKEIACRLGLSVRYKSALWSEIWTDLQQEKLDVICTAATITEERKRIFDFSRPYLDIQLAIVTRDDSKIGRFEDLQGKTAGVRIATSAEDYLRERAKSGVIHTFHMNMDAYEALRKGSLDAVVDDSPIAKSFARSTPGLKLAATIAGTDAQYGIMLRKGSEALRKAIDDALASIEAEGKYLEIFRKWFGQE